MKTKKFWTLTKSIEEANKIGIEVSRPTLIRWICTFNFGFQLGGEGGKWYLFPEQFMRYLNGGKTATNEIQQSGIESGTTTGQPDETTNQE